MTTRRRAGRDRRHRTPGRPRALLVRYAEEEYAAIVAAASRRGLTPSGFVAEAALSAGRVVGADPESLRELIAARGQLRRYGNNVNQAVRAFHSVGQAPAWLIDAIGLADQAVRRIDQAAERLAHPNVVRPTRNPAPERTPNGGPPSPAPPAQCDGGDR